VSHGRRPARGCSDCRGESGYASFPFVSAAGCRRRSTWRGACGAPSINWSDDPDPPQNGDADSWCVIAQIAALESAKLVEMLLGEDKLLPFMIEAQGSAVECPTLMHQRSLRRQVIYWVRRPNPGELRSLMPDSVNAGPCLGLNPSLWPRADGSRQSVVQNSRSPPRSPRDLRAVGPCLL
jgi:hypothetical protein